MGWLTLACFVVAIAFLGEFFLGLAQLRQGRANERARKRLREWATRVEPHEAEGSILKTQGFDPGRSIERTPLFHRAALLLYRAHLFIPLWRFVALTVAMATGVGLFTLQQWMRVEISVAAALISLALPWLFVAWRKRKRMHLFEVQLPEALDLICRALRAGHALSTGLRMVADELDDPIGGEFGHVADEIALGMETRDALANLCHRIDVPDLDFFSTAVLIQRETGGNLAEIMERIGSVVRERHSFYGKVNALTAQNRGAALILLFTPPVFVIVMSMASPAFIDPLWNTDVGNLLAWIVLGLTVVGYAVARRLAVVRA